VLLDTQALPRAYVLPRTQAFSPARHAGLTATQLVGSPDVDLHTMLLVEGDPNTPQEPNGSQPALAASQVEDLGPNVVRITATADVPSYVVLDDFDMALADLLNESAQGAIAEQAVLQRLATGPVHPFSRMAAGQADQSLQQTVGAHAALDDDLLGPGQRLRTDVFGLAEQDGFVRRLTSWSMQRSVLRLGGVAAWLHT